MLLLAKFRVPLAIVSSPEIVLPPLSETPPLLFIVTFVGVFVDGHSSVIVFALEPVKKREAFDAKAIEVLPIEIAPEPTIVAEEPILSVEPLDIERVKPELTVILAQLLFALFEPLIMFVLIITLSLAPGPPTGAVGDQSVVVDHVVPVLEYVNCPFAELIKNRLAIVNAINFEERKDAFIKRLVLV